MKVNKKVIIFCIVILMVAIIIGIYFHKRNNNIANNEIKADDNIDIWRENSSDSEIALYSKGSGANKKIYLGAQPIHYLINKNGDVHTYQDSSYKNERTGKRDPAIVKYIKTLSESELENLENDLKTIIESNNSDSISLESSYWYIKIDGVSTKVNVDMQKSILNKYIE